MKKVICFIYLLSITLSVYAQNTASQAKKKLTLEDAIVKRFSTFYPKRPIDLKWVSGTEQISYQSENRDELILHLPNTRRPDISLKLFQLNESLELAMRAMPIITWINANSFYFRHQGAYYVYNLDTRKGSTLLSFPNDAQNLDFHAESKRLVYTLGHNLYLSTASNSKTAITNFEDPNIVSGQAIARYEFGISKGTFWSPSGERVAFYQKDESEVADYPLLDITSTPGSLRSIKYPMAGQSSESAKVGVFDNSTGKVTYLQVEGPKDQYLTNLAWSPDGHFIYIAIVNRGQNHLWLNQYDAANGKFVKTLFEEKHDKYVEPENPVWFIPNNPEEFLWMSERDGFMHLYRYNTDGKMLGQVTSGKWVVKSILGLSRSGKNLIVTGSDESGLNTYAYSIDMEKGKRKQLSEKSGSHSYKLNGDGILLIDSYSSLKTPYVVDIINTRGKKVTNFQSALSPLGEYAVGEPELIELKAKDGTPLHARMIKPSNFDPNKKYPVLIYVYGGPHAQMVRNSYLAAAPLWMYYWAEQGYIIFTLDNRGSSNRGFEFENVIHRQLGVLEVEDQMKGVEYLKSLPYVDGNRLGVHGWSYGGFMTLSLLLKQPDVFNVGVAGGPVTDWKYYEVMYGERYMDTPEENPDGYAQSSILNQTDKLQSKLLLIHGTVDDVVVMQHNMSLLKKFVEEGTQVDFFPYPMHPHNVRGRDRVHLMEKVLQYIDANIGK